jgi:hypothetical protein
MPATWLSKVSGADFVQVSKKPRLKGWRSSPLQRGTLCRLGRALTDAFRLALSLFPNYIVYHRQPSRQTSSFAYSPVRGSHANNYRIVGSPEVL